MLEVVTAARPIAEALRTLRRRLAGMTVPDVSISWHGGGGVRGDIVWLRDERFWWRLDAARHPGRCSLMFGHEARTPSHSESATCEINLRTKGADRRLAGALVRDEAGKLYLAHSGKIGGGRTGRRRPAFRAYLAGGNWQTVRWPDGREGELLLIAPLDGPRLGRQIGRFVQAVHRYKRRHIDGDTPMPAALVVPTAAGGAAKRGFAEEATPFAEPPSLAALCDRGLLLDALGDELNRRGLIGEGAPSAPLFATRKLAARLIELETGTSAAALERAVGRLLLRGAGAGDGTRAILVAPDAAAPMLAALARHGVTLVRYRWQRARPVFTGLDAALG
ncbi:hypothetical protein [Reyranella sp. CPCC 100927]|uniref:hypothetical protein n=1 Tax=Reyranella sp. CPCC 100927 TaxID=2599616 RepID=UPI0011B3CB44|nr:hypothetical protein [Reyranella sp. CPCC 100927]TWS99679.1 hypothetical protein FQU96_34985 [Reyranella sp. CPCC 100927]